MKETLSPTRMHELRTRTRLSDRAVTPAQIRRHQRWRQGGGDRRSFYFGSARLKHVPSGDGGLLYFGMASRRNHAASLAEKAPVSALLSSLDNSAPVLSGIEN